MDHPRIRYAFTTKTNDFPRDFVGQYWYAIRGQLFHMLVAPGDFCFVKVGE